MQTEWHFFQSRVARRIFFLFVISALIPIVILAIFQITQFNQQVKANEEMAARKEVKSLGMELAGTLFELGDQVDSLGKRLGNLSEDEMVTEKDKLVKAVPGFTTLSVKTSEGKIIPLTENPAPIAFPAVKLNPGDCKLFYFSATGPAKGLYFVCRPNAAYVLLAQADERQLWSLSLSNDDALLWIVDGEGQVVFSNSEKPLPVNYQVVKKTHTRTLSQELNNQPYYVAYWSLFLDYRLQGKTWAIVLAQPKLSFIAQAKFFEIFLPTTLLALLLTMFLSQSQIRRYLIPLEQLTDATRRLSKQDFTPAPVMKSNDEFEELGEAFNSMSSQLNQQFKTMSIMSMLDQAIVNKASVRRVVAILHSRLNELVQYDWLLICLVKGKTRKSVRIFFDSKTAVPAPQELVPTTSDELARYSHSPELTLSLPDDETPSFLSWFKEEQAHFILFPIIHNDQLASIVCLGFGDKKRRDDCDTQPLHDIFHRLSVAFTQNEWQEKLYHQAHYDDLTQLPNRLVLRQQLSEVLKRSEKEGVYCLLMFIDLDNFKDINDSLGHGVGDLFLSHVAKTMANCIQDRGLLSRLGGDEFTVLVGDLPTPQQARRTATELAEDLLEALDKPFRIGEEEFIGSASIGIVIRSTQTTGDDLLKCADMSMYQAKKGGKHRYVFFSDELEKQVVERNQILQDLNLALKENQFVLYFQPQVDAASGKLASAEVLLRWLHPTRGVLTPRVFIALAEETNSINVIGEWVMRAACQQIKQWQKQGIVVPPIGVNLAARQFTQDNLCDLLVHCVKESGLTPAQIELEITESTLIDNFHQSIAIMNELKAAGFKLALDDFGTGYSSMSYLKKMPIDAMKIDQIFIADLLTNQKNYSIVRAIITLAQSLGLKLIAEGIEEKPQGDLLCQMGCFIHQGYYYSKPIPAQDFFEKYLASQLTVLPH
ncbi:GGDEF domain-containing protein [Legionella taurinensis]|uniref:cyclic-guanylate-specific phosphodiesterase n=1 Tax=Legionella taurinensis TaxID=70611 RepID=A0A3A5LI05_9GAMM|nr:EAL domain-containing protein [Legionella taurinensis]MDX1836698.1 EAL domain-containing protein [Legionella taurinensis]PUT42847.1 hypothetical protein DB744_00240 [Legionella taurinensis]PUT45402.1 hypothetical protein DB746_00240 [Legionella taurinensis]PUT47023.1 hypothetical protein DB743_03760 [Legionella taurinensis]PUT49169.1 hypothetical protein DB745_00240 [Legionella taurinensis]